MIRPRRGTAYSIRTSVATKADVRDLRRGQTILFLTCVAAIEVLAG